MRSRRKRRKRKEREREAAEETRRSPPAQPQGTWNKILNTADYDWDVPALDKNVRTGK